MSRYWDIECRRCGLGLFTHGCHYWTNRMGDEFIGICASGLLSTKPAAEPEANIAVWRVSIVSDMGYGTIDLHEVHSSDCDHDFEPRDEYGEWATSEMWPDGHPKSRVVGGMGEVSCTGLGDGRCIGD